MAPSTKALGVFLLTVGREILVGRTQDSNAHWLAGHLTRLGGNVRQISCVDDQKETIADEIRSARRLGGKVLITTGGLGPTPDDLTLAGVAAATGKHLRSRKATREMIRQRYQALHAEGKIANPGLNPSRLKMARLPAGATPLENHVGTAPGSLLLWQRLHIFSLPGVPSEMKAMFTAEVAPRIASLAAAAGTGAWMELRVRTGLNDESILAPTLKIVRRAFPDVYVKSHASRYGEKTDIVVSFAAAARSENDARSRASAARRLLLDSLGRGT
jgi:molybdenum cofactor synthesis domain-containing protein